MITNGWKNVRLMPNVSPITLVLLVMQSIAGNTEHTDLVKNMETIKYLDYLWKEYGSKETFIADRDGIVRIASRKELVGANISAKDFFRSSIKGAFLPPISYLQMCLLKMNRGC